MQMAYSSPPSLESLPTPSPSQRMMGHSSAPKISSTTCHCGNERSSPLQMSTIGSSTSCKSTPYTIHTSLGPVRRLARRYLIYRPLSARQGAISRYCTPRHSPQIYSRSHLRRSNRDTSLVRGWKGMSVVRIRIGQGEEGGCFSSIVRQHRRCSHGQMIDRFTDRLVDSSKIKKALESLYTTYLAKGASPWMYLRQVGTSAPTR